MPHLDHTVPSPQPAPFRLGHRRWLDGLRGAAVLSVLALHFGLFNVGFLGVDVFFVLSGFLITALLAEEHARTGTICLRGFYARRALRIFPALFALLLVIVVVSYTAVPAAHGRALRAEAAVSLCQITNYPHLHGTAMPTLGHTWSLSLEEQFYLLWPLLLWGLLRLGLSRTSILLLVGLGIAASAGYRAAYFHYLGRGPDASCVSTLLYAGLFSRADALLVGGLTGLLAVWGMLPKRGLVLSLIGVAGAAYLVTLPYTTRHVYFGHARFMYQVHALVALATGAVLVRLVAAPSRLGSLILESAPLVWCGRVSYGLYLFHIPVMGLFPESKWGWVDPLDVLIALALTVAATIVSFKCIEAPCLRLKNRFRRDGARPALPAYAPARAA